MCRDISDRLHRTIDQSLVKLSSFNWICLWTNLQDVSHPRRFLISPNMDSRATKDTIIHCIRSNHGDTFSNNRRLWKMERKEQSKKFPPFLIWFVILIMYRKATTLDGENTWWPQHEREEAIEFNGSSSFYLFERQEYWIETFNFQEGISNTYSGGHEFTLKFPILSSSVQIQAQQISRALKICSKCQSEWSTFVILSLIIPQPTMVGDYFTSIVRFTATPHHDSSCTRIWLRAASSNRYAANRSSMKWRRRKGDQCL